MGFGVLGERTCVSFADKVFLHCTIVMKGKCYLNIIGLFEEGIKYHMEFKTRQPHDIHISIQVAGDIFRIMYTYCKV